MSGVLDVREMSVMVVAMEGWVGWLGMRNEALAGYDLER